MGKIRIDGQLVEYPDPTAIHDDVAGEIAAVAEKASPIGDDWLLIEDSAASNVKKKVKISSLPGGGGGEANTGSNQGTDGVGVFRQKTGVDLQFRHIAPASSKITVVLNGQDIDIDVDQTALTITESQISDLQSYLTAETDTLDSVATRGATTDQTLQLLSNAKLEFNDTSSFIHYDGSTELLLQSIKKIHIVSGAEGATNTRNDFILEQTDIGDSGAFIPGSNAYHFYIYTSDGGDAGSLGGAGGDAADLRIHLGVGGSGSGGSDGDDAEFIIYHGASTERFKIDKDGNIVTGVWNGTAIANAYVANLPTSKITSGTFADARIAQSNVTQHEAAIDHDALTNFVANEHIDWTADQGATNIDVGNITEAAVTQHQAALSITESQISDLDHDDTDAIHDNVSGEINAVANKATPVGADIFLIEDSAATNAKKKLTYSNLEAALSITESQISDLGAYITASSSDTLTNKTIDGDNNTISNLDIGNEVDWAAIGDVADRTAFASGDKLLIFEAGVGLRKIDYDDLPSGGGGGITIGDAIGSGTANRVLYEDASNQLAESSNFTYDGTTFTILNNGNNLVVEIENNGTNTALLIDNNSSGMGLYLALGGVAYTAGNHGLYVHKNAADTVADTALAKFFQDNAGSTEPLIEGHNDGTGAVFEAQMDGDGPHFLLTGDPSNTTPADGEFWFDGDYLRFRVGSVTHDLTTSVFQARKTSAQSTTGTMADVTSWLTADIIDSPYSFNTSTGVLTFDVAGTYEISGWIEGGSGTNRTQLETQLHDGTALIAGTVRKNYVSRNSTQNSGGIPIGPYLYVATASDTVKVQVRDIGAVLSINNVILIAKKIK